MGTKGMVTIGEIGFSGVSKNNDYLRRVDMIVEMLEIINTDREGTAYKPLTYGAMCGLLKRFNKDDSGLYRFYRSFKEAKNPSAFFFWKLKQK